MSGNSQETITQIIYCIDQAHIIFLLEANTPLLHIFYVLLLRKSTI